MRQNYPSISDSFDIADSEIFYVDLNVSTYETNNEKVPLYDINKTNEYGDSISRNSPSNCEIEHITYEEGEERHSTQTILCILDVPEFEFAVKDFHIVYNFPKGMCEYVSVALPWHFNYEIHPGPVVEECEDDENTEDVESGFRCSGTASTCDGTCYEEENKLCPGGDGEPPCCHGGEKSDGTPWRPNGECFGGPGSYDYDETTGAIAPIEVMSLPRDGLRSTLTLPHLLSFNRLDRTTAPFANYVQGLDVEPEDLRSIGESRLPVFLQDSIYHQAPRWFFEFSCLDGAFETLHQILLMIREWNTLEEFDIFYNSRGDDSANPDVEGFEGESGQLGCNYEERPLGNSSRQCNDEKDLDDYESESYPKVGYGRWQGSSGSAQ